jgi:hypothetical protein
MTHFNLLCSLVVGNSRGTQYCANRGIQNGEDVSLGLPVFMNFLFIARNFIDIKEFVEKNVLSAYLSTLYNQSNLAFEIAFVRFFSK